MTVATAVSRELDRILPEGPLAIAYSGGGDSTALLHMFRERASVAIIVDHGLSEGSAERTKLAHARAEAIGVPIVRVSWDDPARRPQQAAARMARYTMMGQVLRDHGISALITGHTLDDAWETLAMSDGAAVMLPVTHAPIWPGLRDIDLLRPALSVTRAALRDYNREHGLDWIEDPANDDLAFHRVRVRQESTLKKHEEARRHIHSQWVNITTWANEDLRDLARGEEDAGGNLTLPSASPRLMQAAIACVAGASMFPPLAKVEAVMTSGGTLGGAIIERLPKSFRLRRDPGAVLGRHGVAPLEPETLDAGRSILWDGRFLVTSLADSLALGPVGGDGPKATLPCLRQEGEIVASPLVDGPGTFQPLALQRLRRILEACARCG